MCVFNTKTPILINLMRLRRKLINLISFTAGSFAVQEDAWICRRTRRSALQSLLHPSLPPPVPRIPLRPWPLCVLARDSLSAVRRSFLDLRFEILLRFGIWDFGFKRSICYPRPTRLTACQGTMTKLGSSEVGRFRGRPRPCIAFATSQLPNLPTSNLPTACSQ